MLVHDKFGQEGNVVVIEEFLQGRESSLLAFVSNNRIIPLENAEDHKQILSLIHISEPTRRLRGSRMPSSA